VPQSIAKAVDAIEQGDDYADHIREQAIRRVLEFDERRRKTAEHQGGKDA